jgi:hypothetical protein
LALAAGGAVSRRDRHGHKRSHREPISEEFIALVILLGPLAWPIRWAWRCFRHSA